MKRLFHILIVFQLLCIGCFEDDSNLDIRKINPIEIEGLPQLVVKQMDTLKVEPLIYCLGVPDSELSFEWMLMNYGVIVPRVLDTTMHCCAQITEKPADNYTLRLTVTDKTTGIFRIERYQVRVLSNFENGLLIADTKDGGTTSDLHLVMCREFSSSYPLENENRDIFRNIWEKVNGAPLPGEVLTVHTATGYSNETEASVVTTKGIYSASYKDYVLAGSGEEIFSEAPPFLGTDMWSAAFGFQYNMKWEHMVANGLLFQRSFQFGADKRWSDVVYPAGVKDYDITMMCLPQKSWDIHPTYCYDALGKRMLFFFMRDGYRAADQVGGPFDVNDLSGYDPLFLGQTDAGVTFLVKNKSNGLLQALIMKLTMGFSVSAETRFAQAIFDLNGAKNIEQARFYTMCGQGNAVFYATEKEVYAGPLENITSAQLQWTAGADEKITGIQMYAYGDALAPLGGSHYYQGAGGTEESQASNGHMILITTENSQGEGKVTAVPVVHPHIGQLEKNPKYHVVLEGFGKILGIYKQL